MNSEPATDADSLAGLPLPPPPDTPLQEPLAQAETVIGDPATAQEAAPSGASGAARFTRLRVFATGGMGRLWIARDDRLQRDVALKELRPELGGDAEVGRRFLSEARITGRLEHPGVVPIYELALEGGSASYAMRLLQGRTLSDAIKAYHARDKGASDVLERAALLQALVAVCNTVGFAHARGVVHRDLKGQNVLLGDFGEVIVLDWGLAKEVGAPPDADSPVPITLGEADSQTLPGQVLGTPYYMSPEQAAGETAKIDARSDVYSLGAILYEILTGQAPFIDQSRLQGEKTVDALLRRIRTEAPTKPCELAPGAPAPLEAICLKALAKNSDDRYQTAQALAQEIKCWLADEPVEAHPDPWHVRLRRWGRRHQTMAASLGVLVLAALVGLVITTVLVNQEKTRTERARAKAQRNFEKAQEAVDRYFTQVSEDRLLDEPGMLPLRKELLASARAFYEDFARKRKHDPASRYALAEAQLKLARITRAMGERQEALKILEQARSQFEELATAHPENESYALGLGQSTLTHGRESYLLHGRSAEAEADLKKALSTISKLAEKTPTPLHRDELAHAWNTVAAYYDGTYRLDGKDGSDKIAQKHEQALLDAAALWKKLADEEPNNPQRVKDLAGGFSNLSNFYGKRRDDFKWKDYLDKSLALRQQLAERYPKSLEYQESLAASYNNLGLYFKSRSQWDDAEKALGEAIAIRKKLARENRQDVKIQESLARSLFNLGNTYYLQISGAAPARRGELFAKSKEAYEPALEIGKRLYDDHPDEDHLRQEYAETLVCMGDLEAESKASLGLPWYDQAMEHLAELQKRDGKDAETRIFLRNAYWGRAEAHTELQHFDMAASDWDQALKLDDGSHKQAWQAKRTLARLEGIRALAIADGKHQKAAAAIEEVAKGETSARLKTDLAYLLALCAQGAEKDMKAELVDAYGARAIDLIRQARADGFFRDNPNSTVLATLRNIGPIGRRTDFQQLAKEIEDKK